MTKALLFIAAVVLSLSLFARTASAEVWTPKPPGAQPTQAEIDEASTRYQKGIQLYEVEGDVQSALVELQRAYDVAPNFVVLFNIGQVARTARNYVTSLRAFEGYLKYGGANVPADKRPIVEGEIKALKELVATVKITTNATEGTIVVDDVDQGRLPMESVLVNPGAHKITIQSGLRNASATITVVGGEQKAIDLQLSADVGITPPPEGERKTSYAFVGWIVSGVLGAGAIATGSVALVEKSNLDDMAYSGSEIPEELQSKRDTVTALSVTTDVLIGAAVLGAGISLYFTVRDANAAKKDDAPKTAFRVSPSGLSLVGSF